MNLKVISSISVVQMNNTQRSNQMQFAFLADLIHTGPTLRTSVGKSPTTVALSSSNQTAPSMMSPLWRQPAQLFSSRLCAMPFSCF